MLAVDPLAWDEAFDRNADVARAVVEDICLLAGDDRVVRGFVVTRPPHFFDRDFIELLVVAAEHRGRRPVRELMRAAVVTATTSSVVFTSTNQSNAPMRSLLESEGWRFSGKLDGLDEADPEYAYHLRRWHRAGVRHVRFLAQCGSSPSVVARPAWLLAQRGCSPSVVARVVRVPHRAASRGGRVV